ncbi:TPA: hypothetical protein ACH3X1_010224 [Trebouxia sp. C0004]
MRISSAVAVLTGAVERPKRDASAVEAPLMELGRRTVARAPAPTALPRELPARFTPKKLWAESKGPSPEAQAAPGGPPPASKGQKEGGPCAVCFATKSATWRRGAQGGKHSGEPLCNKCGVWEFRHPDSPPRDEMDFERGAISRRGSSIPGVTRRLYAHARAPVHQPLLNDQARALSRQPSTDDAARDIGMAQTDTSAMAATALTASAVRAAATAVPTAAVSRMQPWENNLARIPAADQNSIVQPWAQSAFAQAAAIPADSSMHQPSHAQEDPILGAASKKRTASGSFAEPIAKRWQIGAFQGARIGNVSNNSSLWGAANAAGLSDDDKHDSESSEMAHSVSRLQSQHSDIRLKVKLSHAASVQKPEVMDESRDA